MAAWFSSKSWQASIFIRQSCFFCDKHVFRSSQVSEIGFRIFSQDFGTSGSGSFVKFVFSGKSNFGKIVFTQVLVLAFFQFHVDFVHEVGLVKSFVACKIKSV